MSLVYPRNGGEHLLQTVKSLHANIADLIDELVQRDQTIAQRNAQIAALTAKATPPKIDERLREAITWARGSYPFNHDLPSMQKFVAVLADAAETPPDAPDDRPPQ